MSLATRCPACGTVFRVVRDQLKVSEGWVRCGRCSEVFNAAQRLFDLEQDRNALAALPTHAPGATARGAVPTKVAPADAARAGLAPLSPATARVKSAWAPPSEPAVLWAPESKPLPFAASTAVTAATAANAAIEASGEPHADKAAEAPADAVTAAPTILAASATASGTPEPAALAELQPAQPDAVRARELASQPQAQPEAQPVDEAAAEPQPTPGFVLRADRDARRRHPARRSTLALLSLLLATLLAAQMSLHYRDSLAAGWPASRPWLQAACNALGCRIEAPRRIDSLSVDSSGLVRVEGSALYRLSLVVHNRAPTPVRMPAIDLALTDTQGQTMARRVLSIAELGHPAASLPARGEVALQAMLELGEQRVAGYTVELFYP